MLGGSDKKHDLPKLEAMRLIPQDIAITVPGLRNSGAGTQGLHFKADIHIYSGHCSWPRGVGRHVRVSV